MVAAVPHLLSYNSLALPKEQQYEKQSNFLINFFLSVTK